MTTPFEYAQQQHEHPTPPAARTKGSKTWLGYCLVFVTEAFGVGPRDPSAAAAWANAQHKHYETDPTKIPRGVPVFWTGGSHGYGHIALTRGGDSCWSTDFVRTGWVDVAPISAIGPGWGLTLVGWAEDVNGVRVYTPPAPPKPPKPKPLSAAQKEKAIRRRARDAEAAGHPGWADRLKAWADRIGKRAS